MAASNSPQALVDVCPVAPLVVYPGGQGTQARCFFSPGPYELTGQVVTPG